MKSKVNQLQMMQQNLQNTTMQKQQLNVQLTEVTSALKEIESTSQAYKIVGNIMVASDKETLKKELEDKKKVLELRLSNMEKQEDKIREKCDEIQKEVVGGMKNEK